MNLKERRKVLGFTQVQIAIKIGVSLVTYQLWERGVTKPNNENLKKLYDVLKIEDVEKVSG